MPPLTTLAPCCALVVLSSFLLGAEARAQAAPAVHPGAPSLPSGRRATPAVEWHANPDGTLGCERPDFFGLRARIDPRGLEVEMNSPWSKPGSDAECARARVGMVSFGRVGQHHPVPTAAPEPRGDRIEVQREGVLEWYAQHRLGVEQGWTISAAPAHLGAQRASESDDPLLAEQLWIGLEFHGLSAQLTEDGLAARLVDERAQEKLRYQWLKAWDARGKPLTARMRVLAAGLGICVDDKNAEYPITIDPVLGFSGWMYESGVANNAAMECATGGDVNGDGYGDLIVAYYVFDDQGNTDSGIVYAFYGSPSGPSTTPSWPPMGIPPYQALSRTGSTVACVGDINNDGFDDIAVGSFGYDNPEAEEGAVFIYRGGPLGLEATPGWTLEGNVPGLRLCQSSYVGDVNKDGFDDILVSSASGGPPGEARLYAGSAAAPPALIWTMTATQLGLAGSYFSAGSPRVGGAGDVNNDGYDDVLLGAFNGSSTGHAYLFLGGPSGPATSPAWSVTQPGSTAATNFGVFARGVGDIDGDGDSDVVVNDDIYPNIVGAVRVYANASGSLPGTPTMSILGGFHIGGGGGSQTYLAGDVNGDGFADLALGSGDGHVWVYLGSPAGLPVGPSLDLIAPNIHCNNFGSFVSAGGDVNGDGYGDVIVADPNFANGQTDEGAVFLYYGQQGPNPVSLPIAPHPTSLLGTSSSRFGTSLSASGDVNGDGFNDLLVGSPNFSNLSSEAGKAELHLGSKNGAVAASVWSIEGQGPGRKLGTSVAFAGDVDNDGFGDVIVGEPNHTGTASNEGRLLLFRGNASGLLGATPAFEFSPAEASALLGSSVAGAGDVNGDGLADVIVGAPGAHAGQPDRGAAYIFYGRRTAPYLVAGPVLDAGLAGIKFGAAVAPAGDVNADGFSDVLIGSPKGGVLNEEGIVFLHLGSINGLVTSANWTYSPNLAGAHFGSALYTAGDLDADGISDIAIGAPDYNPGSNGGAVFVFRGKTGASPNVVVPPVATLLGAQAGSHFGAAVAPAGDVNGDGYSDLAIGAPDFNAGQVGQGRFEVFLGVSTGLAPTPGFTYNGTTQAGNVGAALAPAGDQDGDGFSDFLAGGPGLSGGTGAVVIHEGGSPYGAQAVAQQRRALDTYAIQHLCLADSTANMLLKGVSKTYLDVAATVAGPERIRLEWELKRMPLPLDGTSLQHGTGTPGVDWVDCGTNSALAVPVPSLQPQYGYHWRMRVQNKNPLFPHSRWVTIQGNGRQEKKFGTGSDCNGNNTPDDLDIANLTSPDCDPIGPLGPNGIPDECELVGNNINGNAIPDTCEAQIPFCVPGTNGTINCPCNNNPVGANRGCENSLGTGGAAISGSGVASLSNDTFVLSANGIGHAGTGCSGSVTNVTCILMQGPTLNPTGVPFGDGVRCFAGALKRLNTAASVSGVYSYGPGVALRSAQLGDPISSYSPRHYLVYYRDSCTGFCPASNFNATNGWRVIWQP